MDGGSYHPLCSSGQLYFFGVDKYNELQQGWCCMQRDNILKILAEHRDELRQQFGVRSLVPHHREFDERAVHRVQSGQSIHRRTTSDAQEKISCHTG